MKKIFLFLFFSLLITHYSLHATAYPLSEKVPGSGAVPLDILTAQPSLIVVPTTGAYADRYMFTVYGSTLKIIDLQSWSEYQTQPDSFETDIADIALLSNGTSLIIALTDGNLCRIELDDEDTFFNTEEATEETTDDEDTETITDSREILLADQMTTAGFSYIVADPDVEKYVYAVNSSGYYFEINIESEEITEMALAGASRSESADPTAVGSDETDTTSNYIPTEMTLAQASNGDKILISTDTGDIITITPGNMAYSVVANTSTNITDTPNFSKIALTPSNDYAYLIDSMNDVLWAYSVRSDEFLDQQSSGTSLDPIEIDADTNLDFVDVLVFEDLAGNVVAYVSGTNGITVLDASDPTAEFAIIDALPNEGGSDSPITMSATPGPLAATTSAAGYVFSANADATISVLSEGPWVTIVLIDPDAVTATSSTFAITFQTDTAGTYTVKANSDLAGVGGTELIAATAVADVDTDVITPTIDINSFERSTFVEGNNNILVFVTDAESRVGHNAAVLHVDRPPEATTISAVGFGNERAYVDFVPSPDADIASYHVYAEPAESQTSPTCPGTLTFASSNTTVNSFATSACSDTTCETSVRNLTNETTYCVAVKIVDEGGQESPLSSYSTAVTPHQTAGPAGFFGETNCALNNKARAPQGFWFCGLCMMGCIGIMRMMKSRFAALLLLACLLPLTIHAAEKTPQHWTFEVKGSMWFPTDTAIKDFVDPCCHFGGEAGFGWLYKNQLNVVAGAGFGYNSGNAVAIATGEASSDTYDLYLFPLRLDVIYRLDLKSDQLFLPYALVGVDAVVFREDTAGSVITNVKYGVHAGVGVGILLDRVESLSPDIESDVGVNDIYLTLEGRYAMLNSFKSTGMDLSGFYPYVGLLFEF